MSIKLKPEELAPDLRRRFEKTPRLVARAMKAGANRSKRLLVRRTPTDKGQMRNSWRVIGDARTTGVLTADQLPQLINDAPHAGIIEKGARPHKVNAAGREALVAWAMRQLGVSEEEAQAVMMAVVMKLRKHGQKGRFIVQNSMNEIRRDMAEEIVRRIQKAAKKKASQIR